MISYFCGVFANENMMSKRIAKIVANLTTTVSSWQRIDVGSKPQKSEIEKKHQHRVSEDLAL
jgi:hypothetical protein